MSRAWKIKKTAPGPSLYKTRTFRARRVAESLWIIVFSKLRLWRDSPEYRVEELV
ncbi:hypothetical protein PAXRUDRAFT_835156, partial [Paxillus rubicundulus Ve08.2h10]